jgi:hypothetical protein
MSFAGEEDEGSAEAVRIRKNPKPFSFGLWQRAQLLIPFCKRLFEILGGKWTA